MNFANVAKRRATLSRWARVALAAGGLLLIALCLVHARYISPPDQSTWWNPATWGAGPPHELAPLGEELVRATLTLRLPENPGELEVIEELGQGISAAPRHRDLRRLASGELKLADLRGAERDAYVRAEAALVRLLALGGTGQPLPSLTEAIAAAHLHAVRERPLEAARWCLGSLRLARQQLAARGAGVRLGAALAPGCGRALAVPEAADIAAEVERLLEAWPNGRLAACWTATELELHLYGGLLEPSQLARVPSELQSSIERSGIFPGFRQYWWSSQQHRRARCEVVEIDAVKERESTLERRLLETCSDLKRRWSLWSDQFPPYLACAEEDWGQSPAERRSQELHRIVESILEAAGWGGGQAATVQE